MSAYDRPGHAREDMAVAALRRLAPSLDGEPDPDFRAATRARLVAMAAVRTPAQAPASGLQRLLAGRAPELPPARRRARFTAGLTGAALTVTALAALVAVADGAGPGDVLYDLKRGTEQTQLALAGDSRGRTLLDFASTRLDELETLVADGATALPAATPADPAGGTVSATGPDPALVLETLRTMDGQTQQGAVWLAERAVATEDARPLEDLAEWAFAQAGGLAALEGLVPDAAADAVERSLTLLAEVGARTGGLEAALACPAGPAVEGSDDLGPVPAACAAPEVTPPGPTGGGGTDPGTGQPGGGTAPEVTTPALPTVPPAAVPTTTGPGTGGGPGVLPTPVVPTPTPTTPGDGLLPPLPSSAPKAPSSPTIQLPPGSVSVCLPPLGVGNC
ncbi:DUF5667 domain-containing protein [Blastococcus mobilis]|uniref:DUF5667 domain-containing protein n=1 Tax=Blastococcus mobilis TaxID=1938746 RepID=A0A238WQ30_9ACTN|nr:DUF5667 domain-containing protein [Blastococcus mobilis]SNR48710.1 hypothetical protein SAMN06272737_10953 [Blastococcus mobilis]